MMKRHETRSRRADAHSPNPKTTFPRRMRAEALRLRRSSLVSLHLACALAAGGACGAYFAFSPWDPSMGADAFAQLLGATMPLMAGIVCGLDADGESEATGLSGLLAVPSRRGALAARVSALWLMGALALALSVCAFSIILVLAGREALGAGAYAGAALGLAFGSVPLYLALYPVALRWGRNAAIAAGTAGLMLALFSVGGLAHGLMTGELTAVNAGALSCLPTSWAVLLGSLPVELAIAAGQTGSAVEPGQVADAVLSAGCLCTVGIALIAVLASIWIPRFEPAQRGD